MKFISFRIKNFKGIKDLTLHLDKTPLSDIYTLVGLNESGKTTILEAISYLQYKAPYKNSLESLEEISKYYIKDIHDCIPVGKIDNFNEQISIKFFLELDKTDEELIKNYIMQKFNFTIKEAIKNINIDQVYKFNNSKFAGANNLWGISIIGREKYGKKNIKFGSNTNTKKNWPDIFKYIITLIPDILYFPNFLFDFPQKIYLNEEYKNATNDFYKNVIQDILDSLENKTNINDHIFKRIQSADNPATKALEGLLLKMSKNVTDKILQSWGSIVPNSLSSLNIQIKSGTNEKGAYLEFFINDDSGLYSINQRSLGFRWFFVFLLLTHYRKYNKNSVNNNILFLFDEPASNLHPSAQSQLLDMFKELGGGNCKIIYTTHSHYLINPEWLESVYIVKNQAIDYKDSAYIASNLKETNIKIQRYREFVANNPKQTTYFQPILDVLEYKPSELENIPDVIMVEGKNDFYVFNYINNIVFKKAYNLNFLPGTSSGNFESLISLYIGWGRKFIVLLDSDDAGKKEKERYEKIFKISTDNKIFTLNDIDTNWDNFAAEKLFTDTDKINIQNTIFPESSKYNKDNFNRAIQELTLRNKGITLEKNTEQNFHKVFNFLNVKINSEQSI